MNAIASDHWFAMEAVQARLREPSGKSGDRLIQVRTNPISGRTSRIAFSRINEKEAGTDALPPPPPDADDRKRCP